MKVFHFFYCFSEDVADPRWDGKTCPNNISLSIGVRAKVHTESNEAGLVACTHTFGSSFYFFEVLVEFLWRLVDDWLGGRFTNDLLGLFGGNH